MTALAPLAIKFLFCLFALLAVAGAFIAVYSGRVIRGVSGLAICSVGLSGLFYFLRVPFLALMEILIYIGAVCVTIVFAIMLAEPEETIAEELRDRNRPGAVLWMLLGTVTGFVLFVVIALLGISHRWAPPAARVNEGTVEDLGISLLTTYSLGFELISLVLLAGILGAIALARGGRKSAQ